MQRDAPPSHTKMIITTYLLSLLDWRFAISSLFFYISFIVVRRIWFHPLSSVPGPKLAAVSNLYVAYWDVYRNGTFLRDKMPQLHAQYGPVVRISPTEVQIHGDPELFHRVHSMQTQYIKDPSFYDCIGVPTAAFGTINPHVHRARRSILNPMFSKRRITEASAIMEGVVQKFCGLLDTFCEDSRPVPLSNAFYCVTVDIISTFTFGTPWGMLDEKDFTGEWVEGVLSFTGMLQARIHFPKVLGIMETLGNIFPSLTPLVFVKLLQECNRCVKLAIDQDAKSKAAGIPPKERPETIYDALLNPVSSKAQRPSVEELVSESISMVTAGTDTSATVLQCCVWNILTRTEVRETLLDELSTVRRDTNGLLPLKQLEELPYLTAFIKETLRFNTPTPARWPRVVPSGGLTISASKPGRATFLPEGTSIAFHIDLLHRDPRIFTQPDEFLPERWMGQSGRELDRWLLSFNKGDRGCIGINLAYAEIQLVIGNLFGRFELELFETTEKDMEMVDHFVGHLVGRVKVLAKKRVVDEHMV